MTSIVDGTVRIQTSSESIASPPSWFGEVVLLAAHLRKHDLLTKIAERVRFAQQIALCHQRRMHPGGVLPAAPALCGSLHGLV